ncbi:MAG: baseplate J/gp47 family protein [Acidimicrobiia bacterium]
MTAHHDCGCCSPTTPGTLAAVENRPWLSVVSYRIGTFATFRTAILDQLSHTPALAALATRTNDDYTVTAVELWSAVADVLTFYQERIANESFLRTATMRDSLLRLVRQIGYELRPGVAATTQLAFTLEPGATAVIGKGTRVQSVPGEGQKPQKYETIAAIAADARLNALRLVPAPTPVFPTGARTSRASIAPDVEALDAAAALASGDRVVAFAPSAVEALTVGEVTVDADELIVQWSVPINAAAFVDAFDASDPRTQVYKVGRTFRPFGCDAPPTVVVAEVPGTPPDPTKTYLTQAHTDFGLDVSGGAMPLDARYPGLKSGAAVLVVATDTSGATTAVPCSVSGVGERLAQRTATTVTTLATKVVACSATVTHLELSPSSSTALPSSSDVRDVVVYELVGPPLRFWPYAYAAQVTANDVFVPGRRSGWSTVEVGRTIEKGAVKAGTDLDPTDLATGRMVLLTDDAGESPVTATIAAAIIVGSDVRFASTDADANTVERLGLSPGLATPITVVVSKHLDGALTLSNTRRELTVTIGSLPPQTISLPPLVNASNDDVALALQDAIRGALQGVPTFERARVFELDGTLAISAGVPGDRVGVGPSQNDAKTIVTLGLDAPNVRFMDGVVSPPVATLPSTIPAGSVRVTIGLDPPADHLVPSVTISTAANLAAALSPAIGPAVNVVATADERILVLPPVPLHEPRVFIRVSLDVDRPFALDTASARLLGNVAPATHGETVHAEVLGDGDAASAFQHFTLKKKPVTYAPSAAPGGVSSSLQLLVDGVKWTEVPTLFGASAGAEVYVARVADDRTLTVTFGDGSAGARLSTGRQNIVVTYRQGIGLEGRVGAFALTTLLDRATGVKKVTNLRAADGGADPETMERARDAAPATVRTFGRAVSLRDFEDAALMAGEVAKVSATWVWTGERRAVHLTIGANGGVAFSADGLTRIAATLASERDPNHKVLIDNYVPVAVTVDASLIVDDRFVAEDVRTRARTALLDSLSFARRSFAEPLYLSDVFSVLQEVEGVVAVDVNTLDLKNADGAFRAAHGVDDTLGQPQPRLVMLPARPIGSGAVLAAELAVVEVPTQDITLTSIGGLAQ